MEKYGWLGNDEIFLIFFIVATMCLLNMQGMSTWPSLSTLPTMAHCQALHILT